MAIYFSKLEGALSSIQYFVWHVPLLRCVFFFFFLSYPQFTFGNMRFLSSMGCLVPSTKRVQSFFILYGKIPLDVEDKKKAQWLF